MIKTREWIIYAVAYCRQHGWPKTRDQLWQGYYNKTITAKQFNRITEVLTAKGLTHV